MGEGDFNQFVRRRNQLVVAADIFLREQNLPPVVQSTLSKDMEQQLKLVRKVTDFVDCLKRRICVTLLRFKEDNPQTSYAQVRLFGRKTQEEKFQQIVYVNINLPNLYIFLTSRIHCLIKRLLTIPFVVLFKKVIPTFLLYSFILFIQVRMSWNIGDN